MWKKLLQKEILVQEISLGVIEAFSQSRELPDGPGQGFVCELSLRDNGQKRGSERHAEFLGVGIHGVYLGKNAIPY